MTHRNVVDPEEPVDSVYPIRRKVCLFLLGAGRRGRQVCFWFLRGIRSYGFPFGFRLIEERLQDAHGGLLVEYGPALSRGTSGVPEVPFGFVAAEGFLHPKQGEGGAPGEALGKVADLPGREAFLAVEVDGKPYDDGVRGFGLNEGEQFLKKGGAGTHEDGFAGKGHAAPGIRNRNAGAFLAVVYGEVLHKNPLRNASVCPGMKAALRVAESPVEGIP